MLSHWRINIASWWGLPDANWFFPGEVGVDLFFALSGFLIGRILLDLCSREPTWRDLAVFLIRRWMRTIPLYALALIFLDVFYPRQDASYLSMIKFGTFTQNVWTSMPRDNWFATSWTLPIEEWFYVLFGVGALGAVIFTRSMRLASVPLVLFLVLPLLLRCMVPTIDLLNAGLLKMVPFRLDGIGYGVLLAWLQRRRSLVFAHPIMAMMAGLVLLAATGLDWWRVYPPLLRLFVILLPVTMVAGCALLIPAALRLGPMPEPFGWASRTISRQSYGLYLSHWILLVPVIQLAWADHRLSTPVATALAVTLPFFVAEAASRLVEQPLMRLRPSQ